MRIAYLFAFIAAILLSVGPARAQVALTTCATDTSISTAECRIVADSVYTIETDSAGTYANRKYDKISITCYYPATVVTTCAGGGDFDRSSLTGRLCRDNADGAYIIQDNESGDNTQCFQRLNFGLNGIIDARQCGVMGDGLPLSGTFGGANYHPDDGDRLNACIRSAQGVGYHIVSTGGGVVFANENTITVLDGMTLTCGGTNIKATGSNDFRILKTGNLQLQKAIVIDPTSASGSPQTVLLNGQNTSLTHCLIEAGPGPQNADGTYPNQFSPAIWYPGCDAGTLTSCTDDSATTFRSSILESSAFNPNPTAQYPGSCAPNCGPASASTGVTIEGSHANVRDVTILGFGTCLALGTQGDTGEHAPDAVGDRIDADCNTGVRVFHSNAPFFSDTKVTPDLTGGPYRLWTIEKIEAATGGGYKVTARIENGAADDGYRIKNDDTVWIGTGIGGGRESARGRWMVSNISPLDFHCPVVNTYNCQSFTLTGSLSSPFSMAGRVDNNPTDGTSPNAITLLPLTGANLNLIGVGQKVTDTGGCWGANGTTVDAVWPAKGIVFVHDAPACTLSGGSGTNDTITFTDNSFVLPDGYDCQGGTPNEDITHGCVFVQAGFRFGDGIDIHDTGGASIVNCSAAEHMVAFHMNAGANNAHLSNCASDSNISLPDRNLASMNLHTDQYDDFDRQNIVGLLIDGDACEVSVIGSRLGQHRQVGAVVNSSCDHNNALTGDGFGVANEQGAAIALELDTGTVGLVNDHATDSALFKSGESTFLPSSDVMKNTTVYLENGAAVESTAGCGNMFKTFVPALTQSCGNAWSE